MKFQQLITLIFSAFGLVETDAGLITSGGTASSPAVQVGSEGGKPLFGRVQVSTNPSFQ